MKSRPTNIRKTRENWALFSAVVYTFLLSLSIVGSLHYGISPVNNRDLWGFLGGCTAAGMSFGGLFHTIDQLQRETGASDK